jgi:cytosine deaminase
LPSTHLDDPQHLIRSALDEARRGVAAGGMPFGAVLVVDGTIVARGHNRQIQDQHFLAHAEAVCLTSALTGHTEPLPATATLVATEAPCPMCAATALVAGVTRVVVGEDRHYRGACAWLAEQGVQVQVLDDPDCVDLVTDFRRSHPDRWNRYSAG